MLQYIVVIKCPTTLFQYNVTLIVAYVDRLSRNDLVTSYMLCCVTLG